jgi:hypothetical protein
MFDRTDSLARFSQDLGPKVVEVVYGTDGIGHVVLLSRGARSRNSPVKTA